MPGFPLVVPAAISQKRTASLRDVEDSCAPTIAGSGLTCTVSTGAGSYGGFGFVCATFVFLTPRMAVVFLVHPHPAELKTLGDLSAADWQRHSPAVPNHWQWH